ncbi:hypothetical protein AWM70_03245 [Paenibacillus yonginensis]|uniref:Cyanophage baseplate Pam3 plug gp18 domain-containing protein n=1 Tax=Paenibacillus yonginensis TaxID=1462996 RepID=A0A1B1MX04_9BACL|nr:hypothetical protein [Paenibacillus yonginensis]ANS73710.1 hypothetical protein AWM70_03245 [Paenibacillus yonginensis]
MEYIDIEKELIPYRFDISILNELFTMEVHYNDDYDFFTVDLERDGEVLVAGERLVYGQALFQGVMDNRFPKLTIVPFDESGQQNNVNAATLSESVFLFLIDEAEGEADGDA